MRVPPREFTRTSVSFIATGLVELTVGSSEDDVRECIAAVIKGCTEYGEIGAYDFEFTNF